MYRSKANIPFERAVAHASPDYPFIASAMNVEQGAITEATEAEGSVPSSRNRQFKPLSRSQL